MIPVEVAYAGVAQQVIIPLRVKLGTTVLVAIEQSGICERFSETINLENRVGIYGKLVRLDHPLKADDRIEIYRDLLQDPKEARRQRAKVNQRVSLRSASNKRATF